MSLRKDGVSYAFMKHAVAPIFTFYQLNDILLNRKKIARYFGECKRVTKDKAYNTEQIQQALATADHRMRMIILLLASTGCRLGTIQLLPLLAWLPSLTQNPRSILPKNPPPIADTGVKSSLLMHSSPRNIILGYVCTWYTFGTSSI